ncbi:MAG: hypothetical protein ACPL3C_12230 [Pyrobaculum sp.]|uniref:hypothetical protein n=1 Tax=Pyrobaculum sp. TaxID=2004705 RepID=UPI003CAAE86D
MLTAVIMAGVVELYSEDVRSDCTGPACTIGYAYQKTWTKVWYDDTAREVVGHTGGSDIRSGGIYYFQISRQAHPYLAGCVGDPWSGYQWGRIDYDVVDWYDILVGYVGRWFTLSSIWVYACG